MNDTQPMPDALPDQLPPEASNAEQATVPDVPQASPSSEAQALSAPELEVLEPEAPELEVLEPEVPELEASEPETVLEGQTETPDDLDSALAGLRDENAVLVDVDVSVALAALADLPNFEMDLGVGAVPDAMSEGDLALNAEALEALALEELALENAPSSSADDAVTQAALQAAIADYAERSKKASTSEPAQGLSDELWGGEIPALFELQRGQAASFIPALLLMALGALLTFSLTSTGLPNWGIWHWLSVGASGFGVMLLAHWWSSQRWAQGSLLLGCVLLLGGALNLWLLLDEQLSLMTAYPLYLLVIGLALILTVALTPAPMARAGLLGVVLCGAGVAALALSLGFIQGDILASFVSLAPVIGGVALLFLILPVFVRRR